MIPAFLLLCLYFLVGVIAAAIAWWVKGPIALRYPLLFWLLPIVFAFPSFFADRTLLPVDHAMLLPPWSTLAAETRNRHNANLSDAATQMAPWAKVVRMAWKEGSLPLRHRWNGCGMTLAGNAQSAAFSPLTFLMFALPLARAFTLAVAVKLFLALFGTWLWLSEAGVSRTSAIFGAVSFGLSFAMTPLLLFPHTSVICLWPWALFAIERLREKVAGRRATALLGGVFLLWAVSGHPESAVLGGLFVALWLLARSILGDLPRPGRLFRRVARAAAVAAGLSAFLLVPQALAIASSNRVPIAEDFARRLPARLTPHGPLWWNGFFTAVFPRTLGDGVDSPMLAGVPGSFPEMALGYFGILGWALALAVLRPGTKRRRAEYALLVPLLLGLAIGVGLWPAFEIVLVTPVLKMMFFPRYFTWISLAGAALAAFELDRLRADLAARDRRALLFLAVLAALALLAYEVSQRFRTLHAASDGLDSQKEAFGIAWACLGAAAVVFLLAFWRPTPRMVAALALVLAAFAGIDLLNQGMRLYRSGSPGELYPDTPLLTFLRSRPGPFRVVGEGAVLFPNANVFAGVEDVRTHDPVERRDYVEFLDATCGYPPNDYFKVIKDVNASALDFLNVRYLVSVAGRAPPGQKWRPVYSAGDGTVFENRDVLPRVFAPDRITRVAGAKPGGWVRNAFEAFRTPASAVRPERGWREHAFILGSEAGGALANDRAEVTGYRESTNGAYFRARVEGEQPEAFLVASLTQDGGWSAKDETGRAIETTLANGPFLALRVPRGNHEIVLNYSPPGFFLGVLVSVTCLAAVTVVTLRRRAAQPLSRHPSTVRPSAVLAAALLNPSFWLGAATAVLLAGLAVSRWPSPKAALHVPATPIDFTSTKMAPLWNFLAKVRDDVPPGASYTILAPNTDEEMTLYMFSLGVLDRRRALPTSYFGIPRPEGSSARYVIVYGPARPEIGPARLVRDVGEGAVYVRSVGH